MLTAVNPDTSQAVLLDHRICDTRYPFAYTLYTKEQNALMHKYRGCSGSWPTPGTTWCMRPAPWTAC
ncbi:MAG: hypothetical protein R6V15_15915 [Desulfotignum sp.]